MPRSRYGDGAYGDIPQGAPRAEMSAQEMLMYGGKTPYQASQNFAQGQSLRENLATGGASGENPYIQAVSDRQKLRNDFLNHPMNQEAMANPNSSPTLVNTLRSMGAQYPRPAALGGHSSPVQMAAAPRPMSPPPVVPQQASASETPIAPSNWKPLPAPPKIVDPPMTRDQVNRSLSDYRARAKTPAVNGMGMPAGQPQAQAGPLTTAIGNATYSGKRSFGYTHEQALAQGLQAEHDIASGESRNAMANAQAALDQQKAKFYASPIAIEMQALQAGLSPDVAKAMGARGAGVPSVPGGSQPVVNANNDQMVVQDQAPAVAGIFNDQANKDLSFQELVKRLNQNPVPGQNDPNSPVGKAVRSLLKSRYSSETLAAKNPDVIYGANPNSWPITRRIQSAMTFGHGGQNSWLGDPIEEANSTHQASTLMAELERQTTPKKPNFTSLPAAPLVSADAMNSMFGGLTKSIQDAARNTVGSIYGSLPSYNEIPSALEKMIRVSRH